MKTYKKRTPRKRPKKGDGGPKEDSTVEEDAADRSLAEEAVAREQKMLGRRITPQRVIPVALRPNILYFYHGHPLAGHKGVSRVRNEMGKKVWWPGITHDIRRHIEGCRCAKGYRELKQPRPNLIKSLLQEAPSFGKHLRIDCSARGPDQYAIETWDQYAAGVAWTYNSSWNPRTGMIPMAVAFGQLPRGVVDLAMPDLVEE